MLPITQFLSVPSELNMTDFSRNTVTEIDFLGQVIFPTGFSFKQTEVGGLSGLVYDPQKQVYYAISDDRSQKSPARFYTLNIDLSDAELNSGDVTFEDVTPLLDANGQPFTLNSLDPEGITLTNQGTIYISSEGDANRLINPFVNGFSITGEQLAVLPVPNKFLPTTDRSQGIRNNLAFESLTITPNNRYLYTATENALYQDGPAATLEDESPVRILRFDLTTGQPDKEFLYLTDPIAASPEPADGSSNNGLVELLALDNNGNFLALERSFSTGVGNTLKLYEVSLQNTTDIRDVESLEGIDVDAVAAKRLLLDFSELGITLDNFEGMSLGATLPDGRQSLLVVSDNNFSATQSTQVLAFGLDLKNIPAVAPKLETPSLGRQDPSSPDADDPAIYVHPTDSSKSLVITALKDGGLAVYDLNGEEVQRIAPKDIRYNNVDLVYGFQVGGQKLDLAIATDRKNDTLAIWAIDPETQQLTDITATSLSESDASIFGEDDGEQTAYGIATYTSPVSGKTFVFVSQRAGNQISQLELTENGDSTISAEPIRMLSAPIPPDAELEDAQFEGMVVDRESGYLYAAQEKRGIWKFLAEPDAPIEGNLIEAVKPEGNVLTADAEGLTIYYGANGTGYLLASSQGDSSFAIFTREGSNDYLGSFIIDDGEDGVAESDGAEVINVSFGEQFPNGLLVVHDGSNEPAEVSLDEEGEEVQNFNTNFKLVAWEDIADAFTNPLKIDSKSYNPRHPQAASLNVASGDVTQTSSVLWAKSNFTGEVRFEFSICPNFDYIFGYTSRRITDPLQPVKAEFTGLTPGQIYYYRAIDATGAVAIGEFKTSAAAGTSQGFRFGVSGDWRGELAPYPAIANAIDRNLDLFVLHGDTIYADYPSPALEKPQAQTLDEYRLKQAEVYGQRFGTNFWSDLRATTPILATIDDHEVTNDFQGGEDLADATPETQSLFGAEGGLVNDSPLYETGLHAFQEYNPIRDEFYGNTGDKRTAHERKLYRYNTYGQDAATIVLDNRSFRDTTLPDVANLTDPTQIAAFLARSFDIDPATGQPTDRRTMLGQQQLQDLKQDLLDAEAQGITWKFVMVPEPIQNLGLLAASDRFEGYAAERTEILKFIDDNEIDNVVFVAADIHGTVVNNLTYQVAPGQAQIATNAFEISTGSVAFDAPLGPTIADLGTQVGLLTPEQEALYDTLLVANDGDSLLNDKDDFIKQITDNGLMPLGYDPIGLNNNLSQADGLINATLLQGDYIAAHIYGWTEFDVDPATQKLTVTTYGIPYYTESQLLNNPADILSRTPTIVSQFEVSPNLN